MVERKKTIRVDEGNLSDVQNSAVPISELTLRDLYGAREDGRLGKLENVLAVTS